MSFLAESGMSFLAESGMSFLAESGRLFLAVREVIFGGVKEINFGGVKEINFGWVKEVILAESRRLFWLSQGGYFGWVKEVNFGWVKEVNSYSWDPVCPFGHCPFGVSLVFNFPGGFSGLPRLGPGWSLRTLPIRMVFVNNVKYVKPYGLPQISILYIDYEQQWLYVHNFYLSKIKY